MKVERQTWIEDLVRDVPGAVGYLRRQGIRCLACGEPIWGTLEQAARDKGYDDEAIDGFVAELNSMTLGAS